MKSIGRALAFLLALACAPASAQTTVFSLPVLQGQPSPADLFVLEHVAAPVGQRTSTVSAANVAAYVLSGLPGTVPIQGLTAQILAETSRAEGAEGVNAAASAAAQATANAALPLAGGTLTGPLAGPSMASASPTGCAVTAGAYDPNGSYSWVPTCSISLIGNRMDQYLFYPVTGTAAVPGSNPYQPSSTLGTKTQDIFQCITRDEAVPENCFSMSMDVTTGGTALKGYDQKVMGYWLVRMHPGTSGSLPGDTWAFNPDLQIGAGSGNALAILTEWDINNFDKDAYVGGPAFRVAHWNNYLSGFPIIYGEQNSAITNNNTGTANVSGTTVTSVSGVGFTSDVSTITISGTLYRVSSYTDATHVQLVANLGTLTGVSYAWNSHAVHAVYNIDGDNLAKDVDFQSGSSAANFMLAHGNHNFLFNGTQDSAPYFAALRAGSSIAFNGIDANLYYGGSNCLDYTQNASFVLLLCAPTAGGIDGVKISNGAAGAGSTISAYSGNEANVPLNLSGQGTGGVQVSGALTMAGVGTAPQIVGTSPNGGGSAAVLAKSAGNSAVAWWNTGAATDAGKWDVLTAAGTMYFRALNDAEGQASTWLQVNRSGYAVTGIAFGVDPTAPTPAAGDSSTKLATTAFVSAYAPLAGAAFSGGVSAPTLSATGTIAGGKFNAPLSTPASSSATCSAGDRLADANYLYVCTAANTYKRVALTAF